ncbi:MAG: amidohydrolase family protein, partial [Proteobacteria bacterium]|nr:amidohydrolase family protein [Pseudomonadota bacterium]
MKTKISIFCFILTLHFSVFAKVTIIHNIHGNTINQGKQVVFDAIAFEDGKVLQIGKKDSLQNQFKSANLIDGKSKSLLPGLHDAHGHVFGLAKLKNEIDLMSVTSLEESLQIIQKFIDEHPNNSWILGRGWNQALWKGKQFPTYKDLD